MYVSSLLKCFLPIRMLCKNQSAKLKKFLFRSKHNGLIKLLLAELMALAFLKEGSFSLVAETIGFGKA